MKFDWYFELSLKSLSCHVCLGMVDLVCLGILSWSNFQYFPNINNKYFKINVNGALFKKNRFFSIFLLAAVCFLILFLFSRAI